MIKEKTYNKEYIRKVFTNKLIKFIEENGEGLYDKEFGISFLNNMMRNT